jgi:hypothetical protein
MHRSDLLREDNRADTNGGASHQCGRLHLTLLPADDGPAPSAIGSPSAAGARAPSICCLTSVSVAPSIAVAPDPPLEVGSFVPRADVALSAERHSKHELGPDGVGGAVSIASKI